MKIAVYEHLTASGNIYSPTWVEGDAILKASIEDLKAAGHKVYVIDSIPPKRPVDLVMVIAPSSGRIIYSLVKACEDEGLNVVNSPSSAIFLASDKALLLRNLQLHNIKTPQTIISSFDEGLKNIEQALLTYGKVVVKPADGDGCIGLSVLTHPDEASMALRKARQYTKLPYFIIQEFVNGISISVNVLSSEDIVIPLSVNLQKVSLKNPIEHSSYIGNVVPYEESKDLAISMALKTIKSLGHVKGFFGVDMILKDHELYVVEVNPRLTTSYLALREISASNILEIMVKAYFDKSILEPPRLKGTAIVEKIIADRDMLLRPGDLKIPSEAKLLSTIADKRPIVRRGEAYAIYVVKKLNVSWIADFQSSRY
ncbi:MAG: ATP-grasp domain-containing protein [Candidatus Nezhaarchaeales archaeon]